MGEEALLLVFACISNGFWSIAGKCPRQMGLHDENKALPEFHGHPFTTAFMYGFYNRHLIFVEPMITVEYLKSEPSFHDTVVCPPVYERPGICPGAYSIAYDANSKTGSLTLVALR